MSDYILTRPTPDLNPPDYFLFPMLKTELKRDHFAIIDLREFEELNDVPETDFSRAMKKLRVRRHCARSYIKCAITIE